MRHSSAALPPSAVATFNGGMPGRVATVMPLAVEAACACAGRPVLAARLPRLRLARLRRQTRRAAGHPQLLHCREHAAMMAHDCLHARGRLASVTRTTHPGDLLLGMTRRDE